MRHNERSAHVRLEAIRGTTVGTNIAADQSSQNSLLAALPKRDFQRIATQLEEVSLTLKQVVYDRSSPLRFVYFPINAVVSLVVRFSDGDMTEVATIGKEGVVGLPAFLRAHRTPFVAFAQIEGRALRMSAHAFSTEIQQQGALADVLFRYTQAFFVQVAQGGACNQLHSVRQRCARWLLMCNDRVGSEQFVLTQEFLCQMLGVRRTTVSEIASGLQDAGLIRYSRGRITILDRSGLEDVCCECYQVIRDEYDNAFSSKPRTRSRR